MPYLRDGRRSIRIVVKSKDVAAAVADSGLARSTSLSDRLDTVY